MNKSITLLMVAVFCFMNLCTAQAPFTFEGIDMYGRIDDITFDPTVENKLYAVTLGNHIMVSYNKGETWDILYAFPENEVHLKHLRYLNGHQLSFYVDYSLALTGIYIYDIDSNSIVKQFILPIPQNSDREWVAYYDVYENDTDVVIAYQGYRIGFAGYGKVYYTNDGGDNWIEIYFTENYSEVFPNSVAVSPDNPEKLFIMRDTGQDNDAGGIMISQDAGQTWTTHLIGSSFYAMTFHPADPNNILAGTFLGPETQTQDIYRSLDGGTNWTALNLSWTDESMDNINKIVYNPSNYDHIIVLEENEVVITNDGGITWTSYVYPIEDPTIYYFGLNASFNPYLPNEVFINANYYPMFSTDGGETMSMFYTPFYLSTLVTVFDNGIEKHLYHTVQEGMVHNNLNTGEENHHDILPINLISNDSSPHYFVDPYIPERLYSFRGGFMGSNLYVSDDNGQTNNSIYQIFYDGLVTLTRDPNDSHKVWVSFYDSGVKILDFSDMFNVVETDVTLPDFGLVHSIFIEEANSDEVIITLNNNVYKSTDGGLTWDDLSNGLDLDYNDMIYDLKRNPLNPDMYMLAAHSGIYKTVNAGQSWQLVHSDFNVRKIKFSSITNGHVIVSVPTSNYNSSKVLYSENNGNTWNVVPTEMMANTGTYSMDFNFSAESVDVYMATIDLGLVKYTIDLMVLNNPEFDSTNNPLLIYPNPSSDVVNVDVTDQNIRTTSVYNSSGALVHQSQGQKVVSIAHLSAGVYFFMVTTETGNTFVKKVIKK